MFCYLTLIKTISILVCTHITFSLLSFNLNWWWVGRWKAPFEPKSSEVHPTNSQSVPSLIMGFEYIKRFTTNPLWGPLKPLVRIIAHIVVSDLLINPFSLREPTHTREILDPITKDTFYISFVCSTIYHVFT